MRTISPEEFRDDPTRRAALAKLLTDETLNEALQALMWHGPQFRAQPMGMSPTDGATRLGHICGYAEFPSNLLLLTEPLRKAEQPEATYAPPSDTEEET